MKKTYIMFFCFAVLMVFGVSAGGNLEYDSAIAKQLTKDLNSTLDTKSGKLTIENHSEIVITLRNENREYQIWDKEMHVYLDGENIFTSMSPEKCRVARDLILERIGEKEAFLAHDFNESKRRMLWDSDTRVIEYFIPVVYELDGQSKFFYLKEGESLNFDELRNIAQKNDKTLEIYRGDISFIFYPDGGLGFREFGQDSLAKTLWQIMQDKGSLFYDKPLFSYREIVAGNAE